MKHILKFMTYASYNSLLELCYCMDQFALPKPAPGEEDEEEGKDDEEREGETTESRPAM